ncbi:hypothetical protein F4801DRAFT_581555 [Xylaria longipes]|nr:hypothetical protein F4801DRAFT_581555 [Xylaria longipes]
MSRASQALQQGQDLVGDPEDVKIDVQAGAEFLHCNHRPAPGKRYVIIVDALFPDSSTWDHSIYASLQAWAAFRDQAKTWARICLFQPQPESGWYGQFNEATIIFGTQPEEREVEVQQDDKYVENLVGAIASELDTISTAMPDSDVMIVCDEALIQALGTWLPTHSFENRYFIQLTATEQEEAVKKAASANNPASFLVTFGITNVYCEIKNLRAILYVDPQNREVYSAGLRTVSMTKSSMSIGDIDYCRELLTRHANKDNASLLCRFKKQGDTSRPKRQILVDPFVTVFLIVGMLKGCRVRILSQLIKLPHHVSIYVNKLIKLEFLQETRGSSASTEDIHTLDRVVTLRHDRAEETFYLMMKADRTDLGLCWIEAGISPPANDQISRVTIDATRALTLLIALLRHRRLGRAGITIDYTANTQGKDVPMIINERINSNLPLHLRNWAHMGLPWLLILLCDKVIRDKSFLSDTNPWVQVLPHITMDSAFLRSMSDDIDRIRCRSFYGGPIFAFGGDLNTSSHVTTCYELVMRQILDAFSYRLVSLNNLHLEPRAFEFFTGVITST